MKHFLSLCLAMTLIVACGGAETQNALDADQKITLAATVAKEIQATPSKATDILKKHKLTQEQFEDLLYDIASDPKQSQKYQAALQK